MSRQIAELENILTLLIEEHRRMLAQIQSQQNAMRLFQLDAMQDSVHRQESSRLRIASLDHRRQLLVQQIAKLARLNGTNVTIAQLANLFPQEGARLLGLRDELKSLARQIADRAHVAGRLASAVLGHLNTAMRLFAGAVGQAGTYTKNGVPRVVNRIGVMEAVG
jgi:hypothetical protein